MQKFINEWFEDLIDSKRVAQWGKLVLAAIKPSKISLNIGMSYLEKKKLKPFSLI